MEQLLQKIKLKKSVKILVLFICTSILFFQNCADNAFKVTSMKSTVGGLGAVDINNDNSSNNTVSTQPPATNTTEVVVGNTTYMLKSTSYTVSNAVDILFVIDNSKSMDAEQAAIQSKFSKFSDIIKNLDFRLGITSTDVYNEAGSLYTFKDNKNYLTPQSSKLINGVNCDFGCLFQKRIQIGSDGSSDERGIYAANLSILNNSDSTHADYNWIRPNANLAIILLSDEDERSDGGANKSTPFEKLDQPQSLIDSINAHFTNKSFAFHSIVIPSTDPLVASQYYTQCYYDQRFGTDDMTGDYYGHHYEALSHLTNGLIGSVCAADYTTQLQNFAQNIKANVGSVALDCMPVQNNMYGVQVFLTDNGKKVELILNNGFKVDGNKIILTQPDQSIGSTIDVNYTCIKN